MVIVAIVGLVTILSVPNFTRYLNTWRLNGETQEFASTLRTARSVAVMKNIDVVFSFDMDTNTYSYFEDVDRDGSRDANEYRSARYELPDNIVIAGHTLASSTLTFGSKGNTQANGTITLRNTINQTKGIRIYGGTGNITVD
jgi:Tfp pilus assembly protein FimT